MSLSQNTKLSAMRPRIVTASPTALWNTGVATSTLAGRDLVTLGVVGQWYRLSKAYLVLSAFNALATVTIRVYETVAGAVRLKVNHNWIVATDGVLVPIMGDDEEAEVFGALRVEVYSNVAADDNLAAPYEYRIKNW